MLLNGDRHISMFQLCHKSHESFCEFKTCFIGCTPWPACLCKYRSAKQMVAPQWRFSHTTVSMVYREWSVKRKFPVSGGSLGENAEKNIQLLQPRYAEEHFWTHNTSDLDGLQLQKTTKKNANAFSWWWFNYLGGILVARFEPSAPLKQCMCYSLPEYCCWLCPSVHEHSVPIFWWLNPTG